MKHKKIFPVIFLLFILVFSQPLRVTGVIPVHDWLKYLQDEVAHKIKMSYFQRIINLVGFIKKIERETKEFFENIYAAIKSSDLIPAKDLLWQLLNGTYLLDLKKKDPWWVVWQTDVKLQDVFPELHNFGYLKENVLYRTDRDYRKSADQVIAYLKEKNRELENLKDHLNLMRESYAKNIRWVNQLSNKLTEYARANNVGKLIALLANLELMNARLYLTLNLNKRVMMTLKLKQETWDRVNMVRDVNRGYWNHEE